MTTLTCWMWILLQWISPAHAKAEVFFVPNRGQAEPGVRFTVQSPHLTAWFLQEEIRFRIGEDEVGFHLVDANGAARIESRDPLAGKANYILGRNPQAWQRNIPIYHEVVYRGIYDGIDMVYEGSRRQLKSNFVVKPGADPSRIRFRYTGVEHLAIDPQGALLLTLHGGTLREEAPEAYQQVGRNHRKVQSRFRMFPDHSIGFTLEEYDRAQTLTIDPPISCSTYLGGAGMDAGTAIANDSTGAVYVAGWTESADFHIRNALRSSPAGVDAFVAKFSADGQTLVYCTYLGGNGDDRAYGIAVDSAGDAFVTGWTGSTDFPVLSAYQTTLAGARDAFIAKLNPAGNGLLYSTYYGGKGYDSGNGIAIDATGIAYVTGETTSTDMPVHYAYQSSSHGGSDAFAIKLSAAGNGLLYATYLGGKADDHGKAIAIDSAGAAYLTGDTFSPDFPTLSAFQSVSGGNQDAFVAKLNSGGGLVYSSYLGGSGGIIGLPEGGAGIAVDLLGNAYVTGTTSSFDFPLLNAMQTTHAGSQPDAFVAKVSPAGTSLVYSTYLGGSSVDVGSAIAVDAAGLAYVAGYTASSDFPSPIVTDVVNHGGYDGFLVQLSADGKTLLQSMCFGGSSNDVVNALSITASAVYLTGQTLSGNFPTVQAFQGSFAGAMDSFVTKIAIASAVPSDTAAFVNLDQVTQGLWKAAYGSNGYAIANDSINYPAYAQVTLSANASSWASSSSDGRALQKSAAADRIASRWYDATGLNIDVNLNDGQTHQIALYFLDWDRQGRTANINVTSVSTGGVLDSRVISGFGNGQYPVWNIAGHVHIQITRTAGTDAVLSGIFFGSAGMPASFAQISSPAPGSTLAGSPVTFSWTPGAGTSGYWLDVGTAPYQGNIFGGAVGAVTSKQVAGLPIDGSTVYVTIYSNINGNYCDRAGTYYRNSYTYTAGQIAQITSPGAGSTFGDSTVTFTWSPGAGATGYWLDVGTAPYVGNIFGGAVGNVTSKQVTGLPMDGKTVYVTLYSNINGSYTANNGAYYRNTYTYMTLKMWAITSPAAGSALGGTTVTFTWTPAAGATGYWLDVGTAPYQGNICCGSVGAVTSRQVTGLPMDGSTVYVTIYAYINGSYTDNTGAYNRYSYTYSAYKIAGITSPAPGSKLSGSTATFTWTAAAGATGYWLDVGTAPYQGNICCGSVGAVTSKQVTGLPVDGSTVYVTIYSNINGSFTDSLGRYYRNSYTYTH